MSTKTPSGFNPGDVVTLKHANGCQCKSGWQAIVVPSEQFPQHHKDMVETIGEKDLDEYFIAVRWIPSIVFSTIESREEFNGFYSKARFEKVNNVAKG